MRFGSSMERYLLGVSKITMVICKQINFRNFREYILKRIQRFHISFVNATLYSYIYLRNLQVQRLNNIQTQIVEGMSH